MSSLSTVPIGFFGEPEFTSAFSKWPSLLSNELMTYKERLGSLRNILNANFIETGKEYRLEIGENHIHFGPEIK